MQTDATPGSLAKKEPTQSERFTAMVMAQFTNQAGELKLTEFQKRLCKSYFIKIDQTLKELEAKRMAKDDKYREKLAFEWKNVNLEKLAIDVVAYSAIGLDPMQPNHLNCIPYKNSASGKLDFGFIIGYRGCEIKATKYGLNPPDVVVVEVVYSNDHFKAQKRNATNRVESYEFEIKDHFNRGQVVGGFYYHGFKDTPEKNRLRIFSKADIEKRKPDHASVEFWGGEKDNWVYDKDKGKRVIDGKVEVEGWYDEMVYKTIYRAAYNSITVDAEKVDDHYTQMMDREREMHDQRVMIEIRENANTGAPLTIAEATDVVIEPEAPTEEPTAETPAKEEAPNNNEVKGPNW